jgi:DNA-directed RNA polymerase specialized sigma subunit
VCLEAKLFTGDEPSFQFYARVRIRGQIWDEIRVESPLPRRMINSTRKPTFNDIDSVVLESHNPTPEHLLHLKNILLQVDSIPFTDRERLVIEALASGQSLGDLALAWGVSQPFVSQIKSKALLKIAALAHKADLG